MTAITFPNSPSSGDTHTAGNGIVYTYDGEKWTSIGTNSAGTWTRSGTTVSLTTAGDDLNVDSGTLFVDASANSVGIGTTTPSSYNASADNLVVQNDGGTGAAGITIRAGTGSQSTIYFADGTGASDAIRGYVQYFHNGDFLRFGTDANERIRITSDGKLGVGTTSPSEKLTVVGDSSFSGGIRATGNNSGSWSSGSGLEILNAGINAYNRSTGAYIAASINTLNWSVNSAGTAYFAGNIGVGTASPSQLLTINKASGNTLQAFSIADSVKAYIGLSGATNSPITGAVTNDLCFRSENANIIFGAASSTRADLYISSAGNVGIGNSAPGAKLQIESTSDQLKLTYPSIASYIHEVHSNGDYSIAKDSSERFRIDSSGDVGIGLNSPSTALDVQKTSTNSSGVVNTLRLRNGGTSGGDGAKLLFTSGTSTDGAGIAGKGVALNSADLAFYAGGNNERMRLDSSGRLGLGTQSPSGILHLSGADPVLRITDSSGTSGNLYGQILFQAGVGGSAVGKVGYNGNDGVLRVHTTGAEPIAFGTSDVEKMRISSAGDVGIDISAPQARLHVHGGITTTFGNSPLAIFGSGFAAGYYSTIGFGPTSSTYTIPPSGIGYTPTDQTNGGKGDLVLGTRNVTTNSAPSERVRITSAGSVFFGKTSDASTTAGVSIVPTYNGHTRFVNATSDSGARVMIVNRQSSNGTLVDYRKADTTVGTITCDSSSTAYNTSSDYRLKENVVNITDGITRVKQLQPKRFNFIIDADTTVDGFLAHETQTVVPEAVTGVKDGEEMQGIDQSKLVPLLTAALKEVITELETLKAEVAALKSA